MIPQTRHQPVPQAWSKQGEWPRLPAAAASHSVQLLQLNPNSLPHEHSSPSWASMDMKVQMNSS